MEIELTFVVKILVSFKLTTSFSFMKKILITDTVHPILPETFRQAGYQVIYNPEISLETVRTMISEFDGIIINSKMLMDKAMLDAGTRLEFIGRLGSGLEIIDLEYAKQKGVGVYNSPEGNRNAVAEHALGMLLSLANNLCRCDREVRQQIWQREANRGFEVVGKTVGIIGFGHTGSTFAKRLRGLDVKILAYDKYKTDFAKALDYVTEASFEDVLKNADIISLHLPLTEETFHLADQRFFAKCRQGFILINTSRGNVVKTQDLIAELKSGKMSGACLDVFENEKLRTFTEREKEMYTELYTFENVVLSPHVAGWTQESKRKMAETLIHKILLSLLTRPLGI